jgi:hypothetical protein
VPLRDIGIQDVILKSNLKSGFPEMQNQKISGSLPGKIGQRI